jgi:hypothetical protein
MNLMVHLQPWLNCISQSLSCLWVDLRMPGFFCLVESSFRNSTGSTVSTTISGFTKMPVGHEQPCHRTIAFIRRFAYFYGTGSRSVISDRYIKDEQGKDIFEIVLVSNFISNRDRRDEDDGIDRSGATTTRQRGRGGKKREERWTPRGRSCARASKPGRAAPSNNKTIQEGRDSKQRSVVPTASEAGRASKGR